MSVVISIMINISVLKSMENASEIVNNTFTVVMAVAAVLGPIILACEFNKGLKINERPSGLSSLYSHPKPVPATNPQSTSLVVYKPSTEAIPENIIQMVEGGELDDE